MIIGIAGQNVLAGLKCHVLKIQSGFMLYRWERYRQLYRWFVSYSFVTPVVQLLLPPQPPRVRAECGQSLVIQCFMCIYPMICPELLNDS